MDEEDDLVSSPPSSPKAVPEQAPESPKQAPEPLPESSNLAPEQAQESPKQAAPITKYDPDAGYFARLALWNKHGDKKHDTYEQFSIRNWGSTVPKPPPKKKKKTGKGNNQDTGGLYDDQLL